ncbi:MAG: permease [Desulfoplanes sp.]|nr:permease [Desulfoplanes sp.]
MGKMTAIGLAIFILWYGVYSQLLGVSNFLTFDFLGLVPGSHLGNAVQFFLYDTPKVLMLLGIVVFAVGILRSFFTPDRTRKILAGKSESAGNVLAAFLGIVTPFCSCSAVPLFIGFVAAGVPLGVTFSFLIAAPMVNEIAVVLLYGLMGWKVAVLYMGTGLCIAIIAGWVIGRLKMEKHIEEWVTLVQNDPTQNSNGVKTLYDRVRYGWQSVKDIVGKVWLYVIIGIALGAAIHGYVPENFMASLMGKSAWWSVPASVIIGIPMYTNAAGIIPIVEALLGKGAALGTVLAFMMSVIALSLPEMIILRKVLKPRLIAVFVGVVGLGILFTGYFFNMVIG